MPVETTMRRYSVTYQSGGGTRTQPVDAAYWQCHGEGVAALDGLIRFKDADHKTVFAVRADLVETITELRAAPAPAPSSAALSWTCTCRTAAELIAGGALADDPSCQLHHGQPTPIVVTF